MDTEHFQEIARGLLAIVAILPDQTDLEVTFARLCIESLLADTKSDAERFEARRGAIQHARHHLHVSWPRLLINASWLDATDKIDERYVDAILWQLELEIVGPKRRAAFGADARDAGQAGSLAQNHNENNNDKPDSCVDYNPNDPGAGMGNQPDQRITVDELIESLLRGDPVPDPDLVDMSVPEGSIGSLA